MKRACAGLAPAVRGNGVADVLRLTAAMCGAGEPSRHGVLLNESRDSRRSRRVVQAPGATDDRGSIECTTKSK
jgi:hypothetical protein